MKSIRNLFYIPALALAVLGGCSDDGADGSKFASDGREINFSTWTDRQAKASVTTQSTLTSFTVAAWGHPAGSAYDSYVLNGVTVTRGETAGASSWDYFPKASWPTEGQVDFFAYSPASSVNITTGLKGPGTTPASGGPAIAYTVPGFVGDSKTADQQEDLLVTKNVNQENPSTPAPVALNFKHALSRVIFKAQNLSTTKTYVIKELALTNLKTTGTLNLTDLPDGNDPIVYQPVGTGYQTFWTGQTGKQTYKADLGSTQVHVPYSAKPADFTDVTNASNGLMVLPQITDLGSFSDGKEMGIMATTVDEDILPYLTATIAEVVATPLGDVVGDAKTFYFRLHDPFDYDAGIVFEAGRQYTFQLTLGASGMAGYGIEFSMPTVSDFDDIEQIVPTPTPITYNIGDPYTVDGLDGVVYALEGAAPSKHGYALALVSGKLRDNAATDVSSWSTNPWNSLNTYLTTTSPGAFPFYDNLASINGSNESGNWQIMPVFTTGVGTTTDVSTWIDTYPPLTSSTVNAQMMEWFRSHVSQSSYSGRESHFVKVEPGGVFSSTSDMGLRWLIIVFNPATPDIAEEVRISYWDGMGFSGSYTSGDSLPGLVIVKF